MVNLTLHLQLITPETTLFDGEAESLTCQTELGQITILPGHMQLVGVLVPGELAVRAAGKRQVFHVGAGIVRVESGSKVSLLVDAAERALDIDRSRSEAAVARAQSLLKEADLSGREYAATAAKLERDLARIKIARKHAHRHKTGINNEGVLSE